MAEQKKLQGILKRRIDELCAENTMSYYALSYKATIPLTTLIHIMDGTTKNPGLLTIVKVCDGLGVTLQEFFDTKEFEELLNETNE
ncbi:MAG: helix-turn-helix transcriptional regulator [Agathobacter sp.]|nr:helix-turn-helix transcriptional regulator [Agathobacter sp.]